MPAQGDGGVGLCRVSGCGDQSADTCFGCNLPMCTPHLFQHDCEQEQARQRQRVLVSEAMLGRGTRGLRLVYWQRWGRFRSERRMHRELRELQGNLRRLEEENAALSAQLAQAPRPKGGGGGGGGGSDAYRKRLWRFYNRYCPAKIGSVDSVLSKYSGREESLFRSLVAKYGPEPPAPKPPAAPSGVNAGTQTDAFDPASVAPAARSSAPSDACVLCAAPAYDECATCGVQACGEHIFDHDCSARTAERKQRSRVLEAFVSSCDRGRRLMCWQRWQRLLQERRGLKELTALRERCREYERRLRQLEEQLRTAEQQRAAAEQQLAAVQCPEADSPRELTVATPTRKSSVAGSDALAPASEPRRWRSTQRLALADSSPWGPGERSMESFASVEPDRVLVHSFTVPPPHPSLTPPQQPQQQQQPPERAPPPALPAAPPQQTPQQELRRRMQQGWLQEQRSLLAAGLARAPCGGQLARAESALLGGPPDSAGAGKGGALRPSPLPSSLPARVRPISSPPLT
eukprot:TRINITY_DN76_c0_g2_i1.p1 TRINITY_DN76_c0_g2~~TRINITY_DN76_c0_g2_i1.p1  ORF type:complete len:539 (+),score=174.10 TRINITY_DN76_c0_g2_i1:69-1619(+)